MGLEERDAALAPESIDCSGAWLFWSEPPEAAFVELLGKMGQLEPVVVAREQGRFLLVSGYKRVLACRELQRPVRFRTISGNDLLKGRMYLHLNLHRSITGSSLIRAARFFQAVSDSDGQTGVEPEFEGLVPKKMLAALRHWLSLDSFWEEALHAGRVPFEAGPILASLKISDRQACKPFFKELSWSWNKARNFLNHLLESAKRDGLHLADLIQEEQFADILQKELSPNDCQKALLQRSTGIRYPVLSRLEQSFQAVQADCLENSRWRMLPEQHFETNGFILQTKISSQRDLERSLQQLQKLCSEDAFAPIRHWRQDHLD